MLNWISNLLGGSSESLPAGVSGEWADKLDRYLKPLDELPTGQGRKGLAREMFRYVFHGEPLAILTEVAQRPAIAERLHLTGYHYGHGKDTPLDLYEQFEQQPAVIGLRWARLLEACLGNPARVFTFQLTNGEHWPEVLLMHAAGHSLTGWSSQRPNLKGLSALAMEGLLVEAGLPASALIAAAFATPVTSRYGAEQRLQLVSDLSGYGDSVDRHVETVRPLLLPAVVPQRLHVLNMLAKVGNHTLAKLAPEICELGVSSSKQVRAAADPLLRRCGEAIFAPLRIVAVQGKPEQRLHGLRLIWSLAKDTANAELEAFARDTAQADKAPSVQALVAEWDSALDVAENINSRYEFAVPKIDWSGALTPEVSKLLDMLWRELNDSVNKANRQSREHHQRMQAQGHNFPLREDKLYTDAEIKALRDYMASSEPRCAGQVHDHQSNWRHAGPVIQKMATAAGMTPVVLLKMLLYFNLAADQEGRLTHPAACAFNAMHRAIGRPTLLELQQMTEAAGFPASGMFRNYCQKWSGALAKDWSNDAVWPFFAHHVDVLIQYLTSPAVNDYSFDRHGLFRAVATLPAPPHEVVKVIFDLALGAGKNDRPIAQEALANHPDKESKIIAALADGKSEVRAVAATWLARLRHQAAVPALEQAVQKEKHDVAKGAMLDALQLLGQPVERYLNRNALAAEASKSLAKGIPKDVDWFPWDALPAVRWADSREPVAADVLKWMLVQAVKQKSPEPNAVLRKYCQMFEPRDRENLGQFILETWLREDVHPITADEAMQRAVSQAQNMQRYMQQYPQYYQNDPNFGRSVEELTAAYLPGFLRQPAGSAIGSKGLLAVAAACAAERAAAPVARYLKEYYGTRAAQGKALIAMLAWIDHPGATQLMLSIGNRFRTKSFQEEATRQAEALAERKGWTLSELADRTIPSAGFDEAGMLELSYGQRRFTAKLLPDFKIELFNPDGKKIAALPEPRQDDDAELAKDAKKAFSSAKKEIKSIVDLQTDRLYEALCTERDWSFEDWSLYLNQHSVMRRLLQRLVWVQIQEGRVVQSFRPLDDGTLTDCDDNEVVIADDARVRIAHDSLLTPDEVSRWQQHLVDYEVSPLFQQLGKGIYSLPANQANDDSIKDFEGNLLEAFALRGRALKLGYTRGAAEDGGWFHVYEKRFPTLGLEAVLEFTGNPLPEENRTVGLLSLYFASSTDKSWQRAKIPLGKVPKVLLSECYNDLRLIAAEGSGFDPDWQKKTEY